MLDVMLSCATVHIHVEEIRNPPTIREVLITTGMYLLYPKHYERLHINIYLLRPLYLWTQW